MTDTLVSALPWVVVAGVAIGILWSLVFSVSGTWERIPTEAEAAAARTLGKPVALERIVLGQVLFLVNGRRDLGAGFQEFSGTMLFRTVRLSRRDHGVANLVKQGFPEVIAQKIDGEVTGKLKLGLIAGGLVLEGTFTPQKVEFTHRPPRVTGRHYLDPLPRRYRRLTADEMVADKVLRAPLEERVTS